MFCKKVFLKKSQISQENPCIGVSCLIKLQAWPTTLSKKRLWHRYFSVNFANLFANTFFIEHPQWLLLHEQKHAEMLDWKEFALVNKKPKILFWFIDKHYGTVLKTGFLRLLWSLDLEIVSAETKPVQEKALFSVQTTWSSHSHWKKSKTTLQNSSVEVFQRFYRNLSNFY